MVRKPLRSTVPCVLTTDHDTCHNETTRALAGLFSGAVWAGALITADGLQAVDTKQNETKHFFCAVCSTFRTETGSTCRSQVKTGIEIILLVLFESFLINSFPSR